MKFFEREDWKNFLTEDSRQILKELGVATKKYKGAYSRADNPKIAQIWSALIEIKKELNNIKGNRLEEYPKIEPIKVEKEESEVEKLVAEVIKTSEADTEEANKKLVESLMRF